MANITVKDLVDDNPTTVALGGFLQDLSEDQLNIQGGHQCDVVIRIGRLFIPCPVNPKPKPILF